MTKLEIIQETVEYYSVDVNRRAINHNPEFRYGCYYKKGKAYCAVGRVMLDPQEEWGGTVDILIDAIGRSIPFNDKLLKPEYHNHSVNFWVDLQKLHDLPSYWNESGLTEEGLEYVSELKERYGNN